jgi:NAD dependent epimerase/dehydratase family enzyme
LVRRGLGGKASNGRQYLSWIHEADFIRAVQFLIDKESVSGPVNLAAPNPVPNSEFMRALRRAWGAPIGLPAARWMLAVGAFVMQTETELVLKSRRVIPGRLAALGFNFRFPTWPEAAIDLCARWRDLRDKRRFAA